MGQRVNIRIPEPCHENWAAMKPSEHGRFCGSCSKTVIDFSSMSDKQLFEFFKDYSGNACGRFTNDQLNRNIAVAPPQRRTGWFRYVITIMIPAMLLGNRSFSQGRVVKKEVKTCVLPKPEPVKTDPVIIGDTILTLPDKLPATGPEALQVMTGGFTTIVVLHKDPVFHQFKKFIADSLKKTTFTIFPNPVAPGTMLRTSFNTRKGQYFIQVIDNNGLLVQEEKLAAHNDHTEIMVRLSKNVFPGLYTVLLTDVKRKRIGSQKLVVQ